MKSVIFISWHNDKQGIGKLISNHFHDYLDKIFDNHIKVFASDVDIKHGWTDELAKALENSKYGIMILTPQALDSAWMPYEFGVLRRNPEQVWCFRFGKVSKDKTPFAFYQYLTFTEKELTILLDDIVRKELSDKEIGWDESNKIKKNIKTYVPKLYAEISEISCRIEDYVSNNEIREKYEDLKNENQSLKDEIAALNARIAQFGSENLLHGNHKTVGDTIFMDLGLPSGTLWADRNIGANSPKDFDKYFPFMYTYEDNMIPTKDQFDELLKHCSTEWKYINGNYGMEFKSKLNGCSIFFTAAGDMNGLLMDGGFYWSRTESRHNEKAWALNFNSNYADMSQIHEAYFLTCRRVFVDKKS